MGPLDALNHVINLLAPALAVAALGAALAKLLWRRELRSVPWRRLAAFGAAASAAVMVGGVVTFGRDGHMATYGAMLLANSLAMWWAAFGPSRR